MRPARTGLLPPPPPPLLLGLLRLLPAGLRAGAGGGPVLGRGRAEGRYSPAGICGARASFLGGESREGGGGRSVTRFPLLDIFFFFLLVVVVILVAEEGS